MKKLVILFAAILPFLFFSCASDSGIPEDSAKNETELTENLEEGSVQDSENFENQENNQNQSGNEDASGNNENAESSNNAETSDNNARNEFEPVEIITEPEIITLEPEEESENKNNDETVAETENGEVELVVDTDLILPDDDLDFSNKTDANENLQNSEETKENESQSDSEKTDSDSDFTDYSEYSNTSENAEFTDIAARKENNTNEEASDTPNDNTETEKSGENDSSDEELDFTSDDSDASEEAEAEEETIEEIVPVPSRTVNLKRGETLIVIYPGSGWIYLGSTSEYNNLTSKGRKLGSTDTTYTLLAKEPGTQLHHFYKTDNLTGNYIDDYLEVTVLDAKGKSSTKITAPSYAEVIPPRPEQIQKNQESAANTEENSGNLQKQTDTSTQESSTVQNDSKNIKEENHQNAESKENNTNQSDKKANTQNQTRNNTKQNATSSNTSNSYNYDSEDDIEFLDDEEEEKSAPVENTDELLEQAKSLYNEKKYTEANTCLSVFFEYASTRRDEALYLQGQIYESESSVKDIKKAVETYKNLIQNYPASPYWDKANKRIIYLNRFYFEAR